MTALPQPPMRLLTIDDYAALDEDEHGRFELQQGRLVMSPSPAPDHMLVMARLIVQPWKQKAPTLIRLGFGAGAPTS
jgi:Uma2 family endonuclease